MKWEYIGRISGQDVHRAEVPGGWLVAIIQTDGCGITFYPDPNHTWNVPVLEV